MEDGAYYDLEADDADLLFQISKPLRDSEQFWLKEKGLEDVRKDNINYWLPKANNGQELFQYEKNNLYHDPRIFISIETICSVINSRVPQPIVSPAQDSVTSSKLADDVSKALYAWGKKHRVNDLFKVLFRNGLIMREGYLKLRFDPTRSKIGDVVSEFVPAEDIIIDKDAKFDQTPRFIAHKIKNKTYSELCEDFPEMEQKIYELAGLKRRDKGGKIVAYQSVLAKTCDIYEVWLQAKIGKETVPAVVWVDGKCQTVLGKMRNPNYTYEDEEGYSGNILDQPLPPFIPFNYLNTGRHYIDDTSMLEQSKTHQKIVNRRGLQIGTNADQTSGGMVFNTAMIKKEEVAQLINDPNEKIGVKGDVGRAFARVPVPQLNPQVLNMLLDSRAQIDDIFGTHDISRGKDSGNKTLGQDQLQIQQDYTRMDDMARALERTATKFYIYLAQMMKVYYTEEHWFKTTGEDGKYDFVMMKSDKIEDGIDIEIETGSTMPMNKERQQKFATDLAGIGLIDPLTLYEVGTGASLPSPQKMLERLLAFKSDPMAYAGSAEQDKVDKQALMDIQILNKGEMPQIPNEITPEYLEYMNEYMLTGDFEETMAKHPEYKVLYEQYMAKVQQLVQFQIEKLSTQMPSPQEMSAVAPVVPEEAQTPQQIV